MRDNPWVKGSERRPTEKDADSEGFVWCHRGKEMWLREWDRYHWDKMHWKRTGIVRPEPPDPNADNRWQPMETAPKDGSSIIGLYSNKDECAIMWSEKPKCAWAGINKEFPPGWVTDGSVAERNLPMDTPMAWRPK